MTPDEVDHESATASAGAQSAEPEPAPKPAESLDPTAAATDNTSSRENGGATRTQADEASKQADASADANGSAGLTPGDATTSEHSANEHSAKKKRRRRKKKAGRDSDHPRPRVSDRTPFHEGEEVFGRVTAVLEHAIMVDLAGKALGVFDRGEMEADDLVPAEGDKLVARVHHDGARGGLVVLTRKPLREEGTKPRVEAALKSGELVQGLVTGSIKGGVEVDIDGLRAFAPASGMDLHPANANFASLVGRRLDFKVVQFENGGRDVVVTRRPMLEAEAHERRKQALTLLHEGQELSGVVRTIVEWGVFVALPDAENLEGLVHATEASHDPRASMADLFKPGQKIPVKITKIDDKGKIWLSHKVCIEDPWGPAKEKYPPGSRHSGKVTRLERFGAFVRLDEDIEGLIHIADLSLDRIEHPSELLQDGADVEVIIHHFDYKNRKIGLHPAPPADRAPEEPQKVARNAAVRAEVIKGEAAGLVVRILGVTGRAARGFVPAGQTGTPRGTDLRKRFKPGTQLDLKVLDIDPKRGEPKLSLRGFEEDEERRAHKEYRQKLKAEGGFGTLGDLFKKVAQPKA